MIRPMRLRPSIDASLAIATALCSNDEAAPRSSARLVACLCLFSFAPTSLFVVVLEVSHIKSSHSSLSGVLASPCSATTEGGSERAHICEAEARTTHLA